MLSSVPFFSFSVLGVCCAFLLVLKSFNYVLRKFKGCLKFKWCFKEVFPVFTESSKGISKKFEGCFKEISSMFQGSFRETLRVFHESFKGVSTKIEGCFKEL